MTALHDRYFLVSSYSSCLLVTKMNLQEIQMFVLLPHPHPRLVGLVASPPHPPPCTRHSPRAPSPKPSPPRHSTCTPLAFCCLIPPHRLICLQRTAGTLVNSPTSSPSWALRQHRQSSSALLSPTAPARCPPPIIMSDKRGPTSAEVAVVPETPTTAPPFAHRWCLQGEDERRGAKEASIPNGGWRARDAQLNSAQLRM